MSDPSDEMAESDILGEVVGLRMGGNDMKVGE
jgi:hypothetical protein